jgi:hypothetical protein
VGKRGIEWHSAHAAENGRVWATCDSGGTVSHVQLRPGQVGIGLGDRCSKVVASPLAEAEGTMLEAVSWGKGT